MNSDMGSVPHPETHVIAVLLFATMYFYIIFVYQFSFSNNAYYFYLLVNDGIFSVRYMLDFF